jgi:hypothetical protein
VQCAIDSSATDRANYLSKNATKVIGGVRPTPRESTFGPEEARKMAVFIEEPELLTYAQRNELEKQVLEEVQYGTYGRDCPEAELRIVPHERKWYEVELKKNGHVVRKVPILYAGWYKKGEFIVKIGHEDHYIKLKSK